MQEQAEKAISAWQEVAQTTLKEKIDEQIRLQTERIEDFATNHEQQLTSLLDGYEEHARCIQAKLLSRLHLDITQKYKEVKNDARQQEAIVPVDDNEGSTVQLSDRILNPPHASKDKATPTQQTTSRWKNVDCMEILTGSHTTTKTAPHVDTAVHHEVHNPMDTHAGSRHVLPRTDASRKALPPDATTVSQNKYLAADYNQLARLRATNTPNQLRGRDRKSVCIFYNSFVDFNRIYRIPLKILDNIRLDRLDQEEETLLYPPGLDHNPQLYDGYSSAIYARLEEEGVLDPTNPLYKGLLLEVYNSRRDGYALLIGILAATVLVQAKDLGALSTPPQPQPGSTPHNFASQQAIE